jgi:23S rRNA (pseudouridine1915-N3)-methyltransferase
MVWAVMNLYVIAFGKLKTPGLREAADHYKKMIRKWVQLEEIELKPIPVPEKSKEIRTQNQLKEGQILIESVKKICPSKRAVFYLLDEIGKARSTLEWANQVETWRQSSVQSVIFCIGSGLGFSPEVRKKAQGTFSFGPQTLSHPLARVVLFEQLYRSWSVVEKHPYHNES